MSSIYTSTPKRKTRVRFSLELFENHVSVTMLEHAPLEEVYIYFDTATYDEIERDEKVLHLGVFVKPFC